MAIAPVGYKTQSIDTAVDAEVYLFSLWRQMDLTQREKLMLRVFKKAAIFSLTGIKSLYPNASPDEIRYHYVRKRLGLNIAELLNSPEYNKELMIEDPIYLARKVAVLLESLGIPYYIGGSVASSLQGEIRFTEDLDLVVNIKSTQVQSILDAFSKYFYISEIAIDDAMCGRTSSFNIIDLETTEKADIFVMRSDAFAISKMERKQLYIPVNRPKSDAIYLCSPEDTILQKLVWYRMTKNDSQRQWRDVLGVLKLQGDRLDFDYMQKWAVELSLSDLLETACTESGIEIFF
ncbi:MAG: hypothetical protein DCF19_11310 [Pseudanabaena frigida]|uniref:Nucleotidyltransferase n=1 Tax=Pseudanabaena frigida TaxID=945775 RepID=A0A2W4W5U1_9CYAN|nr:MAG: hypothetical protein DCF19_11310 [Pseudanabaena frigida]